MSAGHTEGRLRVSADWLITEQGHIPVAEASPHDEAATREANARRLAACWNACEGLETEALEKLPAPWSKILAKDFLNMSRDLATARALLTDILAADDAAIAELKATGLNLLDTETSPAWAMTQRIRAFLAGEGA